MIHWLLTNPYWLATQGIVQNWSGIVAFFGMLMMWHHSCDAHWWCWRPGRHTITDTSWKVCSNHFQEWRADEMRRKHRDKHPDRHKGHHHNTPLADSETVN